MTRHRSTAGWLLIALLTSGCVHQQFVIRTDPPGVHVYYNEQLIGDSPVTHEFLWYEPYRVRVEKQGLPTLQHHGVLKAPLWMWFPLDGLMVIAPLPLTDRHDLAFDFAHPRPDDLANAKEQAEHPIVTHTGVIDDLRRIHQTR